MEYYFTVYMFIVSCFMFSYYLKHLLLTIISLEFMMIMMVFNMFVIMNMINLNLYFIIFLLSVTVCEGALALTLIVVMVRFYGNDYINSLSFMKW